LVRTELRRAVRRRDDALLPVADAVLAALVLVELDADLLDAAGILEPPALRTLDAVHVQSALLVGDELEAFVTYDDRMADAARGASLRVLVPG